MEQFCKEGIISAVNAGNCTARVVFEDKDGMVSAELPILQSSCFENKFYNLPDVGDSVVCLFAPNAQDGTGWIIGSRYSEKNNPPAQSQEMNLIRFSDGTEISYNRASHELKINCVGNIKINGKNIYLNE